MSIRAFEPYDLVIANEVGPGARRAVHWQLTAGTALICAIAVPYEDATNGDRQVHKALAEGD